MPSSSSDLQDHGANTSRAIPCRYWIILLCGLGLIISYADRSNMAVAIVAISQEHGYTKSQQGIILAAFFFGYILTPIIGGTLADRYGGKPILAVGGLVWSVCTLLTPLTSGMGLHWIVIARVLLGLGEGVAFPSIHSMIGVWIPPGERSKAVATVTGFGYMGTIISLPISSALVVSPWGWRGIFWLFGTLGLVWSATWQFLGASEPASCSWITESELQWITQQQQLERRTDQSSRRDSLTDEIIEHPDDQHSGAYEPLAMSTVLENEAPSGSQLPRHGQSGFQASHSTSLQRNSSDNSLAIRADTHGVAVESSSTPLTGSQPSRWQAFRNHVRSQSRGHGAMEATREAVPWKALLARREVWAIILSQLFNSFGFFVMQTWAPTFYLDYYGVDIGKIGFYAVLPSAMQSAVGLTAGYLGDKAVQDWKWTTLRVRRLSQAVGSLGLGVFLILAVLLAPTAAVAMALITVGMALNGFTMTGASAYQHDFCPQYAGFIFSLGNTAGSIPAVIGVFLVGRLLEGGAGCWVLIWTVVCLFYVVGVTSFVLLSTDRRFPRTILTK
ncbi:major facilitator superfamily domain-containing protein [Mortierella sp. GBAus27b]|nr:major facilitator superfamily domain-containing protein [Mortierella sp. GBAus27b]